MSEAARKIRQVRADWREIVLVCRKCSKKLAGGFGPKGDQRLAKVLKGALRPDGRTGKVKGRRARLGVVEIGCLDVCPKNAVVALRSSVPDTWLVIPKGTTMAEMAGLLGLDGRGDELPG